MFYIATTILHLTPAYFWRISPRKFFALCEVHAKVNSEQSKGGNTSRNYNAQDHKADGSIAEPNSYVTDIGWM
jgi:hypothetical protein